MRVKSYFETAAITFPPLDRVEHVTVAASGADGPIRPTPSVEQLSVPLITAIASAIAYLINRDMLADIKPSFENDANIVATPPPESALSNRVKIVERDVEIYRNQA